MKFVGEFSVRVEQGKNLFGKASFNWLMDETFERLLDRLLET